MLSLPHTLRMMLAGLSEDVLFDGLIQQRLRLHYNSGLVRCSFGRTYFLGSLPRFRRATAQKNSPQILPAHSYAEKKERNSRKKYEARQGKLQPCTCVHIPLHIWQILIRPVGPTFRLTRNQIFRNCQHSLKSTLTCSSPRIHTHTHTHVHAHAHLYIEKHTNTAISTCALCMFSAAMLATLFAFCMGVGSARFCISFRLAFCNVCSHMCHIAILSCFCGFGLVFATHTCISICRQLNSHPPAGPVMPVMRLPC